MVPNRLLFISLLCSLPLISCQRDDKLMFFPPYGCREFPGTSLCSSGRCVDIHNVSQPGRPNSPDSKCLCYPGWTGAADFIDMTGHDCSTNKLYVKVFWSINTGLSFILLLLIITKLVKSLIRLDSLLHSAKKPPSEPQNQRHISNISSTPEHSRTQSSTITTSIDVPPSPLKRGLSDQHLQIQQNPGTPDRTRPGTPNKQRPETPDHQVRSGTPDFNRPLTPSLPLNSPAATMTNYQTVLSEFFGWEVVKISLISLPVAICLAVVGLARASGSGEENLLGVCWWTTLCHALAFMISSATQKRTTLQWISVRKKVVKFTEKNAERAEQMILRTRRCLRCLYVADLINFILYNLIPPFSYYANILVILWLGLVALSTWIQAFAITTAATELEKILRDGLDRLRGSSKDEREKTLKNIVRLKNSYRRSIFSPPLMIASTLWPFMRTKASYLLPFATPFQILSHFVGVYNCLYPVSFQNKALGAESHGSKDKGVTQNPGGLNPLNRKPSAATEGVELKQLGSLRENDEESSRHSSPSSTPYLAPRSLDSSIRVPYMASTPSVRPLENPSALTGSLILPSPGLRPTGEMEGLDLGNSGVVGAEGYTSLRLEEDYSTKEIHLLSGSRPESRLSGSRPESRNSPSTDEDIPEVEHDVAAAGRQTTKHIFNPFYREHFGGDGESRPRETD